MRVLKPRHQRPSLRWKKRKNNMEQTGQVYSGPAPREPEPVAAPAPRRRPALVVFLVVLVVFLAVATGYFLFIRNIEGRKTEAQPIENLSEWVEYVNADGFKLAYPLNLELVETADGVTLTGNGEIAFHIRELSGSLKASVGSEDPETYTANSRTGYKVSQNGVTTYFFPLFGNKYLEIVTNGESEEIISKLEFVAPESASAN